MKLLGPVTASSVERGLSPHEYHTERVALFHGATLNRTASILLRLDALKTMQQYNKQGGVTFQDLTKF